MSVAVSVLLSATLVLAACGSTGTPSTTSSAGTSGAAGNTTPQQPTSAPDTSSAAPAGSGTSSAGAAGAAALLPEKYQKGIHAGMLCGAGNISFCDPGSTVGQGVLADVAHGWAAHLGTTVEVEGMAWEALMPSAVSGRTDLVVGIGDLPSRYEQFTFVDIFASGLAVVVPKGNPKGIAKESDLCGLKLSASTGSGEAEQMDRINKECVAAGKPAIDIQLFTEQPATFVAVQSKRVDGTFTDASAAIKLIGDNPDLYANAFTIDGTTMWGVAVPVGNEPLLKAVTAAVAEMIAKNEIASIIDKWKMTGALVQVKESMVNQKPVGK